MGACTRTAERGVLVSHVICADANPSSKPRPQCHHWTRYSHLKQGEENSRERKYDTSPGELLDKSWSSETTPPRPATVGRCAPVISKSPLTFISLHSRESEKAGNSSSYFWTASWAAGREGEDKLVKGPLETAGWHWGPREGCSPESALCPPPLLSDAVSWHCAWGHLHGVELSTRLVAEIAVERDRVSRPSSQHLPACLCQESTQRSMSLCQATSWVLHTFHPWQGPGAGLIASSF